MNISFVLLSYAEDEPAGMERSVASLVEGLNALENKAYIVAAHPVRANDSANIVRLESLELRFPATDEDIVAAVKDNERELLCELENFVEGHEIDIVCWVDALWGLGFLPRMRCVPRSVLMVHVVPPGNSWLEAALSAGHDVVIAPSAFVCSTAKALALSIDDWKVVPNALLGYGVERSLNDRLELLGVGPVRLAARLGSEKGVLPLLECKPAAFPRPVEVALGQAAFEMWSGHQDALWRECSEVAQRRDIRILPAIPWRSVTGFFADASVGIVPSIAETFGLVALECISVGTPVVAFSVGNIPELIDGSGILVDRQDGFEALWEATIDLLNSPDLYCQLSQQGAIRAKKFQPQEVAQSWLRAVSR